MFLRFPFAHAVDRGDHEDQADDEVAPKRAEIIGKSQEPRTNEDPHAQHQIYPTHMAPSAYESAVDGAMNDAS